MPARLPGKGSADLLLVGGLVALGSVETARAVDAADDFYFDSISQIVMNSWTKGRVTLVGDAGYSPGPAVGGGTSIAMVGAYVLAQELAQAGRNYQTGLRAYEDRVRELAAKPAASDPPPCAQILGNHRLLVDPRCSTPRTT
jgi:hypothetical protein